MNWRLIYIQKGTDIFVFQVQNFKYLRLTTNNPIEKLQIIGHLSISHFHILVFLDQRVFHIELIRKITSHVSHPLFDFQNKRCFLRTDLSLKQASS